MSTGENQHRVYRFGEFSLDVDRGAVFRGHRELHLRPKAFRVLRILLDNSGRLMSKAELHEAAWQQSVVTDDSLAHCIADIRRALGDNDFELIKTVPRRGYVFDHAVNEQTVVAAERPARFTYQLGAGVAAIAAGIALFFGVGRSGETPGAGADAGGDVFATAIEVDPSSTDIDAFNENERGRFFFKRRGDGDLERAEASFKAALEHDPEFAGAWTGLAGVYNVHYGKGDLDRDEALPLIGDATRHALRLAPDSAEAHARRAQYYLIAEERALARQHSMTAMSLDPNDVLILGMAAGEFGHRSLFDEAIALQRRAIQGDPTSALAHHNLVWFLLAAGRTAEAAAAAEQYRALYRPGIEDSGELFISVEILQGNYEQALVQARDMANGLMRDRNLAIIHHALRQDAAADAALERLLAAGGEQSNIYAAEVFAHRGATDEAVRLLVGVLDSPERDAPDQLQLRQDTLWLLSPYLIPVRSDERWQALHARVLEARGYTTLLAHARGAGATGRK